MTDYIISTESTADVSLDFLEQHRIEWLPFHFNIDGKDYPDDIGRTMPLKEFYDRMRAGSAPFTSQVNAEEYKIFFEKFLKEGHDILHLSLSSGISGTYNSAMIAMNELSEKYPERKIIVIDTLCACSGLGLLVALAADRRDSGASIDDNAEYINSKRLSIHHWYFTSDLSALIRGGRISKAAGFFGQMLNICPLMNVDREGRLQAREKIRTKKRAMETALHVMEAHCTDGRNHSSRVFVSGADCKEDLDSMTLRLRELFPKAEVIEGNIGTTIGSHTGPGLIALFFEGDERED